MLIERERKGLMRNVLRGLKSVVGGRRNGAAPDDDDTLREIEAHAVKIARGAGDICVDILSTR